MANDALNSNPPTGSNEHITSHGSDFLWAIFTLMAVSDLLVLAWSFTVPKGQRVFHYLAMIILSTASIAYFSMAADLGFANIATEFGHGNLPYNVPRQIWYVRYIDWVITTPALLLELVLASGLPLSDIITLCFFDLVMIITGLIGALVVSSYKWAYFTFGDVALVYIWFVLFGPARSSAGAISAAHQKSFTSSAALLSFLWLLYPIAWGLADGGNVISPDSEMVFYGILDFIAKPVFCFFHLWQLSKLDLTMLQLHSGKFSVGQVGDGNYGNNNGNNGNSNVNYGGNPHDVEKSQRGDDAARAAVIGAGIGGGASQRHQDNNLTSDNLSTNNQASSKKGVFARKGRYDATPSVTSAAGGGARPAVAADNGSIANRSIANGSIANGSIAGRPSGATAVNV